MKSKHKLKCGVIGLGWWGEQMCSSILKSRLYEITTVFDSNLKRKNEFAKKFHARSSSSLDELFESDIDCIFIFSPNQFHVEHALGAASHKKHVFLEKPIANTSKEANLILKACEKNNVVLAVGHNVRYYNIFQEAKKIIQSGEIGDIVFIDGNRSRPIGESITKKSWRFYTETCNGGPLIQMALHLVDTVRYIVGIDNVDSIKRTSVKKYLKTDNDESYSISMSINNKQIFNLFTSYLAQESFYLNFFGTRGTLFVDPFNGLQIQKKGEFTKSSIQYKKNNPEVDEITEFYNKIVKSELFNNPTPEEAVKNVELIEKIIKAE